MPAHVDSRLETVSTIFRFGSNWCVRSMCDRWQQARNTRIPPKSAFSCLLLVYRVSLQWQRRVECTQCGKNASRAPVRRTREVAWSPSEFDLLRQRQGVIDLDPEVTNGALDLGVSEQPRVILRTSLSH
jgi:hypothetical protein